MNSPLPLLRLTLLALSLCCGGRAAAPSVPAPAPANVAELAARLEAHLVAPRFRGGLWGVKIGSLATGRTWFEHHAERLMSPASNSKLYTAALVLDQLGGDYRIRTPILASVGPDAAGELRGDVVVSGRGDPSWTTRGASGNFWDALEPIVAVLVRAGVRRVAGDLVADATWFRGLPHGAGWTADDLNDYYGAEISALSLEQNYAEVRVTPGAQVGGAAELALVQPHTGLVLDNEVGTSAAGSTPVLRVRRLVGETRVHVFGEVPLGGRAANVDVTVPRPADWLAAGLKAALERRGIAVAGRVRSVRWPEPPASNPGYVRLGEVVSPPLRELVARFMKPSQNLETDLVFAHVGELRRTPADPAWRSSEDLAVAALQEFLQRQGLPAAEVRFEEGSGLSRNNLTTANATVALLTVMTQHRAADVFLAALPIAGVDGTLRRRMKGTAAEGNVRGKTGSLRYANSLSGFVTTAAGERLVFSLMLNRYTARLPDREAREELDNIAVMLASFAGRDDREAK